MNRKSLPVILAILLACGFVAAPLCARASAPRQSVLATTFPIYQILRNVVQGRDALKIDLLLSSQLGCPHDYALTPQDMQKLAKADILVVNGLGMEEFLGAPVKKANPRIRIIDSSAGIRETLLFTGEHGHDPHDSGVNPHLFVSPRLNAMLAMNIAAGLGKADPEGAALYAKNARAYAEAMNRLAGEFSALGKRLRNRRIVEPHGVYDYLARDLGLEIVAVMQEHGQEPSAGEMIQIVRAIREKHAGAIFTEPQYPSRAGALLARESGARLAMLDPTASGPANAPLTYYETVMRQNLKTLAATLGAN